MSKEIGITVRKGDDLSEWYSQVVTKAELIDYAPIKGFIVLRPYGFEIWNKVKAYLDARLKETNHSTAYFPLLIPESLIKKEEDHFKGFTPEVFWVTHAGDNQLPERLAIRPTSETIIYDSYARWVRSWRDLPLLINVWNSVLRAEITGTRPFLRTSEFLWQEGHTVHATKEDADGEVLLILNMYRELIEEELAIPVLTGFKSDKEKFVGALYTMTLEAMMPDGKALQMGTSHNLGQNFSKPFDIKYLGKDGVMHLAWTTSWGIAWRLIGAMVMIHGDDRGLVIPPRIAPIQAVIIPIHYKAQDKEPVNKKARWAFKELTEEGISAHLDLREQYTPGWKFNDWELKGIPIRIEIGPRDVSNGQVTLVRRDDSEKINIRDEEAVKAVKELLRQIQETLLKKARALLTGKISQPTDYSSLKQSLESVGGFMRVCWCGSAECEEAIKEETGATLRVIPSQPEQVFSNCIRCGRTASKVAYFARAY